MEKREQIEPGQFGVLVYGFLMGSSLLLPMGAPAKEAAWLATLLGGVAGALLAFLHTALAMRHPDQTLVGYSRLLLGPWLGGLVGALYLWYAFHLGSLVLRNFGEFLVTALLPTTPIGVIMITLMLVCAYAVRQGLETLARAAQVLVTTVVLLVVAAAFMLTREIRTVNLLPLFGDGAGTLLRAAVMIMAFPFAETVIFMMLIPAVAPRRRVRKAMLSGLGIGALTLAFLGALSTAVLGAHIRGASRFATLSVIRQISLADFLTNLDALAIGAWVSTGVVKIAVCLYVCAALFSELFRLLDYRQMVLPIGVAMVGLGILAYTDTSQMTVFLNVWPVYSAPFQILIPLLLLGVSYLRGAPAPAQQADG